MLVLLDEQLPRQLARHLVGHNVQTVQQQSWAGLKNGVLLSKAEAAGFTGFVTGDQSIEHRQNVAARNIGIVVLAGVSNALEDLLPLVASAIACDRPSEACASNSGHRRSRAGVKGLLFLRRNIGSSYPEHMKIFA